MLLGDGEAVTPRGEHAVVIRDERNPNDLWLMQPRGRRATGRVLARLREIQTELVQQLNDVDDDLDELLEERRQIVAELRDVRDGIGGVGSKLHRRDPLPSDVDAVPEHTKPLPTSQLRPVLVAVLRRSSGVDMTTEELYRALLVRGVRPVGRPSKSISDALRTEIKLGRVLRTGRGSYISAEGRW
jgi:hypothetical protein